MSYYEELGVGRTASADEIREAYRTLARLLHPDQQLDANLKSAAERQMKRLNLINDTLGDPDKRRRYDADSEPVHRPPIIIHAPPPPPPARSRLATVSWVAAAVLFGAMVVWLVERETSNSSPAWLESPGAEALPERASTEAPSGPDASRDDGAPVKYENAQREIEALQRLLRESETQRATAISTIAVLQQELHGKYPQPQEPHSQQEARVKPESRPADPVQQEKRDVRATLEKKPQPQPVQHAAAMIPTPKPRGTEPAMALNSEPAPPPPMAPPPVLPVQTPEEHRKQFGGTWFYPHPKTQAPSRAIYPPDFIEASINEENGSLHGRYRARYRVTDRAISPDVAFEFEGKAAGYSASMPWMAGDGSRGEVRLKLVSDNSLEVIWSATKVGKLLGLGAGSAILVRRAD